MSNLETQIRNLSLRSPGKELDTRIHSALSDTTLSSDPQNRMNMEVGVALISQTDAAQGMHASRRGFVLASTGWIAAASMAIGIVIGSTMRPSLFWMSSSETNRVSTKAVQDPEPANSKNVDAGEDASMASSGTTAMSKIGANERPVPSLSSQIVESGWLSPTAAAVAWEQQTGQIFNVVNHVNDRRFNMCRECHRIGG